MSPVKSLHLAALVAAALAFLAPSSGRAAPGVGDAFPPLAAAGLQGPLPATGGAVLLVDFWASWCAPCKASFPAFARLHQEFSAQGLVVVAVSVDESEAACAAFVKRLAPPFAVVRDARQQLVRDLAIPAMPTSFLVGRDGRIRQIHRGFRGAETEEQLRRQVRELLAEKISP